jgi:hypothetical protein
MGNLRSRYTDEEWDKLEKEILAEGEVEDKFKEAMKQALEDIKQEVTGKPVKVKKKKDEQG